MATIAENLQAIIDAKADIKAALIEQGQTPTDEFSAYGDLVRAIESGGGTYVPEEDDATNFIDIITIEEVQ